MLHLAQAHRHGLTPTAVNAASSTPTSGTAAMRADRDSGLRGTISGSGEEVKCVGGYVLLAITPLNATCR